MDKNYVYPYSYNSAKSNGESEQYRQSYKENIACKERIEKVIAERFDGMRLPKDTAKEVIAEFGYDRVNFVLANSVQRKNHDGRFSHKNRDWAKLTCIPFDKVGGIDRRLSFAVDSHPAVLDGFINQARREYQDLKLWEFKHCNETTGLDFEGKVMVLNPICLKDEYKNPRDQLILCDGGFGCNPTASGSKVFGRFLSDGECCQYERSDFIGELKGENLSQWANEKLQEMTKHEQSDPTMGGMKMN